MFSASCLCNNGSGPHAEHSCETVLNLEQWLKDLSYLELWQPLCSVDQNHLCNFGRMHHEEQFCENHLKIFLNLSSGSHFVKRSRTICAILVEGVMRNNSVKLF